MENKKEYITFNIKELREHLDKLFTQNISFHKDAQYYETVISKDDVLNVLFGDSPEKMR